MVVVLFCKWVNMHFMKRVSVLSRVLVGSHHQMLLLLLLISSAPLQPLRASLSITDQMLVLGCTDTSQCHACCIFGMLAVQCKVPSDQPFLAEIAALTMR